MEKEKKEWFKNILKQIGMILQRTAELAAYIVGLKIAVWALGFIFTPLGMLLLSIVLIPTWILITTAGHVKLVNVTSVSVK